MNTQELHDGFQTELVRRGLPADYASGAAEELADHHRDVVEELRATGLDDSAAETEAAQRLGDRRLLVKKAVREFQRRHWCGRWPLLTFFIGPVVLLIAVWVATILVLAAIGLILKAAGVDELHQDRTLTATQYFVSLLFIGWFVFLMPAVVVLFLSRKASRAGLGRGWVVLVACVLALNVGTMKCGFVGHHASELNFTNLETGEKLAPERFVVSLPMCIFFESYQDVYQWFAGDHWQICQFLLPIVMAGFLVCRSKHLTNGAEHRLGTAC